MSHPLTLTLWFPRLLADPICPRSVWVLQQEDQERPGTLVRRNGTLSRHLQGPRLSPMSLPWGTQYSPPATHTSMGRENYHQALCFLTSLSNAMGLALFPFSREDIEARSLKNVPRCHTPNKPQNWHVVPGMPRPGGQALPSHQAAPWNWPLTASCCCSHPQGTGPSIWLRCAVCEGPARGWEPVSDRVWLPHDQEGVKKASLLPASTWAAPCTWPRGRKA